MKLLNKCAVITGGNQGFGLAVAEYFIKEGANVVVCARNATKLEEAKKYLETILIHPKQLVCIPADISNASDNSKVKDAALLNFGTIDILVANAGVYGPKGNIEDVDWTEWMNAVNINLNGTVLSCVSVIPVMKEKKKGKIIILSGGGATKPMPFLSAYAVTKAAVVRFAETLAEELRDHNIQVNAVAPGALNTRLLEEILESGPEKVGNEFYEQSLKQKANGGAPLEKGAALCAYLASDDSKDLTGKLISAVWDPWNKFDKYEKQLSATDIYTLRRIIPQDRGENWD